MKNADLLRVENLSMRFSTHKHTIDAIKDLNFNVSQGEFLSVVGPSGCGKSTLINILAGIMRPTGGRVIFKGAAVDVINPKIGMVFQKYAAFPWMTVEQNISYGPRIAKLPKKKIMEITQHYIEMVGLTGFEHLYPKELSGGMNKRVDIARAYANDPDILLMDEPFGALDDLTKKQMQLELLKIWDLENKTVIFVTHDLEEAVFLSDRVLVMKKPIHGRESIIFIETVPFARPRQPELRADAAFIAIKSKLAEMMGR